jgi:hypothetical protein
MSFQAHPANITVNHHRNGVSGRGFTAITFTLMENDETAYNGTLTGIIPDEDGYKLHDVECFIINPKKPDLNYRGDNFNSVMKKIVEAHDIKVLYQLSNGIIVRSKKQKYVDPGITKFKDMDDVKETIRNPPKKKESKTKRFESIIE